MINALVEMYEHIHQTAVTIIGSTLRDIYTQFESLSKEKENIFKDEIINCKGKQSKHKVNDVDDLVAWILMNLCYRLVSLSFVTSITIIC